MSIEITSQRLTAVHLDFDVTLEFVSGAVVALSEFIVGDTVVDEDNQFEGLRLISAMVGSVCRRGGHDAAGRLVLEFDDGTVITAGARDEVESWEFTSPDGSTTLCEAGGAVVTFPAPDSFPAPTPMPDAVARETAPVGAPRIDATAVKISVGAVTVVEFSDGTSLPVDLSLDDAYLVLREKVTAVREGAQGRITLSSGFVLGSVVHSSE